MFQAIWKNFEKSHVTVTRQWSEVTRPSADCQTTFFGRFKQLGKNVKKVTEGSRDSGRRSRDCRPTVKHIIICMHIIISERERERERERGERERERAREREREGERERPNTTLHLDGESLTKGQKSGKKNLPWQFSRLLTPAPSLSVFHGNLPQQICGASSLVFIMGEREGERERERSEERETERVPCRIILFTMRWELHYICVYPTIFSCVDPRPQLSRFFTGISRRRYVAYVYNGKLISLIGNQRVGIFPPKSEILFVLSLALIWCRNFQDRTIPVGGDALTSFCRKEEE